MIVNEIWCPLGNHSYILRGYFKVKGKRPCFDCTEKKKENELYKNQKLEVSEWS